MFYSSIIVFSLLFLATINQIDGLQCYKCSCAVNPGANTCIDDNDLQCIVEYVENSYCIIVQTSNNLTFDRNPNSDLIFLESLHYLRAREEIIYLESSSSWQVPAVREFSYGCDWNLCNTPRILSLLPKGLTFVVDSNLLTDSLIPQPSESFTTCLSCTRCVNSTGAILCPELNCNGTCFIDDHLDDPVVNAGSCLFAFESVCLNAILNTSVQITGTYYIDDKIFQVSEIDIWCKRTDCNDPTDAQIIQRNITFRTEINDQLYFRPNTVSTTLPTPNDGLLGCYTCNCQRQIGSNDCNILECTIEYKNASYCEIVRDLKSFDGMELIFLGHVARQNVRYKHFIRAEEEIILYRNLSYHPPAISLISYVCDWELCNDGRLVDKLTTSFQFNAEPSEIAAYLQSSEPLSSCADCQICSNSSLDFDRCTNVSCSSTGRCYIDQYIDNPDYNDCEYAFRAECEDFASESSIIITATYSIDDDILDFEEVNVYCSKNGCNRPETVYSLLNLLDEDIQLDSLFFIRRVVNTTSPPIITEPTPTSSIASQTTTVSSSPITAIPSSAIIFIFIIISIFIIN